MGLLKDNNAAHGTVRAALQNALIQLESIDEEKAVNLADWIFKKCRNVKRIGQKRFNKLPSYLKRGDIIRVEFGINIGDELSDYGTDGHFAMIWAQQGLCFLVLPFTKKTQGSNPHAVNIGKINGLPVSADTYVKLDYMRWVYSTRILWINEEKDGKIIIQDNTNPNRLAEVIQLIKDKMAEVFINN
ncbi:MAG: hypothetical protein Q8O09_04885 [Bacillota bacterium]|nr:hypothetical protein [Bacillota bacterium]